MKAIMISIKPKWVAKILNGEKTIDIRKTMPKCDLPIDVYIYCTNNGGNLVYGTEYRGGSFIDEYGITRGYSKRKANEIFGLLNGKVVAKFTLNKVEEYINGHNCDYIKHNASSCLDFEKVLKPSCVSEDELFWYAEDLHFYAWYIDNLVIFDKPKELSEFKTVIEHKKPKDIGLNMWVAKTIKPLTKAPQSWRYVEVEK